MQTKKWSKYRGTSPSIPPAPPCNRLSFDADNQRTSLAWVRSWRLLLAASIGTALPVFSQSTGDTTPPTITSFALDLPTATATSAAMIVTFSEPVTGVDASDFELNTTLSTAATITGVTAGVTAATYHVAFNYTGTSGSLQMAIKTSGTGITDSAGNAFTGGGIAATPPNAVNNAPPADMTLPTVSSFAAPAPVVGSPVNLSLVFSEAVTGVSTDDFRLTPGATVGVVTGSGTTWTVPVSFTGTAPITVTLVGGATSNIRDAATHWFAGGAAGASTTFTPGSTGGGVTAPVISSPLTASVLAGASFSYTIAATNSPMSFTASGMPAGLTFTSPTISGAVAAPGTYNITIGATNTSGTDSRTLVLTVNPPGGATQIISATPPPNGTYGAGQTLTFTATFSAPVTVEIANSGDGRPYFTWTANNPQQPHANNSFGVPAEFPAGHFPPPGSCRIWHPGRPNGQQPPPGDCDQMSMAVPPGAWLISRPAGNPERIRLAVYHSTQPQVEVAVFWFAQSGVMLSQDGSNPPPANPRSSGRVFYTSGSGTPVLTFTYTVDSDDTAPNGITLGTMIQIPQGAAIKDSSGISLTGPALVLPWPANPLNGVILMGGSPNGGKGSGPVVVIKRDDGLVAGQPFTLPATTASGQPITWILVSGNATLNGNVLTPKNRGAVVVRALVPGSTPSQSSPLVEYKIETEDFDSRGRGRSAHRDRLSNLSSRVRVSSSDANRSAIAGFVVTGISSKQVLVRAVGPGLGALGVGNAVPGVSLRLYDQSGALIAQNDGWKGDAAITAAAERVGAFKLASGSPDSALLVTLQPGAYTAQLGAQGSGIALLEVYDAASAAELSTEQLVNISTRGFVDSGEGNLIAGFVVTGDAPKRVLVRGIGAALAGFGVPGALADPVLELYTAGGAALIAHNDDWEISQPSSVTSTAAEILAAMKATGAFPLAGGSKDAALLITLMPGSYSAVVRGANNTTGAGLVEVYEIPNP